MAAAASASTAWVVKDYSLYLSQARKHFRETVKERSGVARSYHRGKVLSLAWNMTGSRLASGSEDKTAAVYTIKSGRTTKELDLRGHTDQVMQVCWNPTCEFHLATASRDKTVKIWDHRIASSKAAHTISTHADNISLAWSPDGNTIAVCNEEDVVEFFETRTGTRTQLKEFNYEVNELNWNNSGSHLFLTNTLGMVDVLDASTLQEALPPLIAHTGNCVCIKFDPINKYFATGGTDAIYSLWDAAELVCVRSFSRQEASVRSLSFSYEGHLLAVAADDVNLEIAHVETGELVYQIPTQPNYTACVAWHPKQLLLAFACDQRDMDGNPVTNSETGQISTFGMTDK
eukprot:m.11076 g.11076  ORF g.11076 m.11076 type:complete len:345 (-) comp5732_c0_seq1:28-1062(-)